MSVLINLVAPNEEGTISVDSLFIPFHQGIWSILRQCLYTCRAFVHCPFLQLSCDTNNHYMMSRLPGSMKVNTSEAPFGDEYPNGIWGEFKNEVSSNIFDNVVALASFNGDFTVMHYLLFHISIES